jgi:6-phosphogluconolactonase
MATDPSSRFLYVAGGLGNDTSISAFTIDPSTGVLTAVSGSPFTAGAGTVSLAVDFTGKFLYTADSAGDGGFPPSGNSISEFSIDGTTGALTLTSQTACFTLGIAPFALAEIVVTDPAAGFLFATNTSANDSDVCSYSINSMGVVQPVTGAPFSLDPGDLAAPAAVAVDPFGKFVYTLEASRLYGFSITPGVGALSPVMGSPFSVASSSNEVTRLAMDPLGRFLFVADLGDVWGYSINPNTGALSLLAGFPLTLTNASSTPIAGIASLAVDPSGKFLIYGNGNFNPTVSVYAINETTGVLTPVPGSPFSVPIQGNRPINLIMVTRKPS